MREFSHGLAAVRANGRWGYIDGAGKLAIEPVWDAAGDFQPMEKPTRQAAGTAGAVWARVSIGTNEAIISRSGALLCDPKYLRIEVDGEFLTASTQGWKTDMIRLSDGKLLGLPDRVEWFQVAGDRAWLPRPEGNPRSGSDWALCDVEGRPLTPYRWARPWASPRVSPFSGGASLSRTPLGTYGLLSPAGKELLAPLYERIGWLAPERAAVWSATEGGLIDSGGKWLFKDNAKTRIARFGYPDEQQIQVPPCHGLVVIEDTPKWGYAKLISSPPIQTRE